VPPRAAVRSASHRVLPELRACRASSANTRKTTHN
jgi:hypothetical protein